MQAYHYFSPSNHGDATVAVATSPDLNGIAQAEFVKQELIQIMEEAEHRLVVDFCNVRTISSAIVTGLLIVKSRASDEGVRLSLTMTDSLRAVFRTLNLDGTVFDIYTTPRQALENSRRSASYFDVCGQLSPPDEDFDM